MRLRTKVLLLLAGFFAVATVLFYVAAGAHTYDGFNEFEVAEGRENTHRLRNTFEERVDQVRVVVRDWSQWDDTYEFVRGEYPGYVDSNLDAATLANLNLDFMVFLDGAGASVYEIAVDPQAEREIPLDPRVVAYFGRNPSLLVWDDLEMTRSGVVLVDDEPFLMALAPITTSDVEGPAAGTLLFGRALDDQLLAELSSTTALPVSSFRISAETMPDDVADALPYVRDQETHVSLVSNETLAGYVLLRDIRGIPAMMLTFRVPRTAFGLALNELAYMSGAFATIGVVLLIITALAFERQFVSRLLRLDTEVARITSWGDIGQRTTDTGRDEIGRLARSIDGMLTSLRRSEDQRRTTEARHASLLENLPDAAFVLDPDWCFTYANCQAEALFGRTAGELEHHAFTDYLDDASRRHFAEWIETAIGGGNGHLVELRVRGEGSPVPVELGATPLNAGDGVLEGIQCIARDVSERKVFEEQLLMLARNDHLTGLLNRRGFEPEFERAVRTARRRSTRGAMVWLDLDNFKDINDSLGHRIGDEVLQEFASFLRGHSRGYGVLARMGGDEFVSLLPGSDAEEARLAVDRLLDDLRTHRFEVAGNEIHLSASAGIVVFPDHGTEPVELLAHADLAMYKAKEAGRNRAILFEPDAAWTEQLEYRVAAGEQISRAFDEELFEIHAQPIVRVDDGAVHSYELLIRMRDEQGGLVMPGDFLGAAERSGKIARIDRWMVRQGILLIEEAARAGRTVRIDVNLSGSAFTDESLLPAIRTALCDADVDPSLLGIEITETAAILDMGQAQAFIRTLADIGCRFALDDFGSGFSSFYYLRRLPIACVKIDGSYIRNLPNNKDDQRLVSSIIELARGMGLDITAEWVENEETLEMLSACGTTFVQGYHLGRPGPVREVLGLAAAPSA